MTAGQGDKMLVPENQMKHPLENEWSFWLFINEMKNWEDNLIELTTFATVEDYWCLYHHMKVPSELKLGQDYAVFKKGIRPMWEDEMNRHCGRWIIMLDRSIKLSVMDSVWSDVVLLLIGDNFKHSNEICGAVVNVRAKSKICVWMRSNQTKSVMEIGRRLKTTLKNNFRIQYCLHNSSKVLYTV